MRRSSSLSESLIAEVKGMTAFSIPLVIGLAASALPATVDTIMLSGFEETNLAAISLTASWLLICYAGLYGFVTPLGVKIAKAYGAGEYSDVLTILKTGFAYVLLGAIAILGIMGLGRFLLEPLGQPPEVRLIIDRYWIPISLCLVPYGLSLLIKQFYDSTDRPWFGLGFSLITMTLNILFNWALIFGNFGFPRLGLAGAAVGTLLAETVGFVILALSIRHLKANHRFGGRFDLHLFKEHFKERILDGAAVGLQYILETGAVALVGIFIGLMGTTALAANQLVNGLMNLLYMIPLGIASGTTVKMAHALEHLGEDEGEPDVQSKRSKLTLVSSAGILIASFWSLGVTLVLVLFGSFLAGIFTSKPELIALVVPAFMAVALMQVFDGIQSVSLGALRGISDNRWPTLVTLVCYWLISVPLSYIIGNVIMVSLAGVWLGFGIGLMIASVTLLSRLRRQIKFQPDRARKEASDGKEIQAVL